MRLFTATILLFAFLAAQYARQVAYFECRLSNYFNTGTGKCDCEKILNSKTSTAPNDLSTPLAHGHSHIDESYVPGKLLLQQDLSSVMVTLKFNRHIDSLNNGFCFTKDRPPQIA